MTYNSGERERIRADHYIKYVAPFVSDFVKKFDLKDATFTASIPSQGGGSGSTTPVFPSMKEYMESVGILSSPSDAVSGSDDGM